jgi:hypothetical protein
MPKIKVVRATARELQQSLRARDYVVGEHHQPGRLRPQKKQPEVLERHPLKHLRGEVELRPSKSD